MFTRVLLFACVFVFFISCAKRGMITGGDKDSIAPVLKMSLPKNFSTQFTGNEIKLQFDEYVKLKDFSKQLIVSPPLEKNVLVYPQTASKSFVFKISDTLKPNTTYSFNFGESIQDNNEGNTLKPFVFVFSTGDYIDSLELKGKIKENLLKEVEGKTTVMLYEYNKSYSDSLIYKKKPYFVCQASDETKEFNFKNVKAGTYKLIAIQDKNNSYTFEPKEEKIAFYPEPITIPDSAFYIMELFKEELITKTYKPTQNSGSKYIMGYQGDITNIGISLIEKDTEKKLKYNKIQDKDSLEIWLPKIEKDTIEFNVTLPNSTNKFKVAYKKQKIDTLSLSSTISGNLPFREKFKILSSTPIEKIDEAKFKLLNKDSLEVKHNIQLNEKELIIHFEKQPLEKYTFLLDDEAVVDIYENKSKAQTFSFSTKNTTDYGNLKIKLENIKAYPILIQLTDDKGKTLAENYLEKGNITEFQLLDPNEYNLRIVYDVNANGKWDTGNFLNKKQPEEVFHFPKKITVRPNWDVEQAVNLTP